MTTRPLSSSVLPPLSREEMERLGWDECDVIIVTGDAYVDHPSFGSAVIARVLLGAGFRTGVIAQPRWDALDDFRQLGRPRLFFGVTAGNVDSLVNHYSPLKQKRRADAYSPGGRMGLRPNRATIVYCNRLREAFPGVCLVLGGIEASLRRLAHYDYWDDTVRRSVLLDAKADIIAYGMAERQVVEISRRLVHGESLVGIPGTVVAVNREHGGAGTAPRFRGGNGDSPSPSRPVLEIPSYEAVRDDKAKFTQAFTAWYQEQAQPKGRTVVQQSGDRYIVQYPPAMPLTQQELDAVYDLPFTRRPHPHYGDSKIPALETVKFSITSHRGCLGSCRFCALAAHQGRVIQWRSKESIVAEARRIVALPDFKGHITDVGGPTANMYAATCPRLSRAVPCRERDCLFPEPCPSLRNDLRQQLDVLGAVRAVPGVNKVSLGTGLRYDQLEPDRAGLEELCRHYVSGQLRVAPEHAAERVLVLMGKTAHAHYLEFIEAFRQTNQRLGRKQYLIPYFISGYPGCTLEDMVVLAEFLESGRARHVAPGLVRQVQDFTPVPMTLAATMYYTETDPLTGDKLYVAKEVRDKKLQRAMLQLRDPKNAAYVTRVLRSTGQKELLRRVLRIVQRAN